MNVFTALQAFLLGDKPGPIAWVVDAKAHQVARPRKTGTCLHLRAQLKTAADVALPFLGQVISFHGDN